MIKKLAGVSMSLLLTFSLFSGAAITANATYDSPLDKAEVGTKTEETIVTMNENAAAQAAAQIDAQADGQQTEPEEMGAYLFVHFIGNEGSEFHEQVYFSVSTDGTNWRTLNAAEPVLESNVGEKGVRDPHIVRSPDGKKFYLVATDLSIFERNGAWGESQTNGSKNIVVWESSNLTDWTCKGLKQISRPDATCTWAPESIWDSERNAYMVYWASKTEDGWKHRVYRCYTTDFETFTEPEVYIEGDGSRIDTTFIKEGDTYYRFTKDEVATYVYMEKSTSLSGDFEAVSTYSINGGSHKNYGGYEGPTVYKLNGEDQWCLLLDNYGTGQGYKPFVTNDITQGQFVSASAFNFNGVKFRHGTVMPITMTEYNALVAKYPFEVKDATTGSVVYQLDFDNEDLAATTGGNATATGSITYENGVNGTKAAKISGDGNFITVPGSALAGLRSFTVSFFVKAGGTKNPSWVFYAAPNADAQKGGSERYVGVRWTNDGKLRCERYYNGRVTPEQAVTFAAKDIWKHVTLVYHVDGTEFYIDGQKVGDTQSSTVNIKLMLGKAPTIQLGKANWGNGEYADIVIDSFKIHNYVLSESEVSALYNADKGVQG